MYTLVLKLDVDIPWPKIWLDFSFYLTIFAIDIDIFFSVNVPYMQLMKFTCVMAMPLFFLFMYRIGASLDVERWKRRFGTNWDTTISRAWALYLISLVIVTVGAAYIYQDTVDLLMVGKQPSPEAMGLITYDTHTHTHT